MCALQVVAASSYWGHRTEVPAGLHRPSNPVPEALPLLHSRKEHCPKPAAGRPLWSDMISGSSEETSAPDEAHEPLFDSSSEPPSQPSELMVSLGRHGVVFQNFMSAISNGLIKKQQ